MNVVKRHHVVQDGQLVLLLGLIQPLQIPMAILRELEQEFPFMASVGALLNAKPI